MTIVEKDIWLDLETEKNHLSSFLKTGVGCIIGKMLLGISYCKASVANTRHVHFFERSKAFLLGSIKLLI